MPAGTPDSIVSKLNTEFVNVMRSADMKGRMATDASIPIGSTPEAFALYFKNEIARYAKVVKFSGAKPY